MPLLLRIDLLSKCLLALGVAGASLAEGVLEPCSALPNSGKLRPQIHREQVVLPQSGFGPDRSGERRAAHAGSGQIGHGDRRVSEARFGPINRGTTNAADGLSAPSAESADSLESGLILAQSPASPLAAARSGPAGARSGEPGGVLVGLLVLGVGLGLLLGRRQGWVRRRQPNHGDDGLEPLLPPPGFRPRTPHERLHDPLYLERMLEAERGDPGRRDSLDSEP